MAQSSSEEQFPPTSSWTCPNCHKVHSKPHFAFPEQIDEKKKPGEVGRVIKDREVGKYGKCGAGVKEGTEEQDESKVIETGPQFDDDGMPQSLFCPHCGFLQNAFIIARTRSRKK